MVHLPAAVERRLRVIFHATPTGREPVREWLRTLSKEERRTIGEDIEFLQRSWPVERPYAAHLRNAVWEVRTSLRDRKARVLFGLDGRTMVLLHGFIKKTRSTPPAEIALTERRLQEYLDGKT